jgi:hypothetical protein
MLWPIKPAEYGGVLAVRSEVSGPIFLWSGAHADHFRDAVLSLRVSRGSGRIPKPAAYEDQFYQPLTNKRFYEKLLAARPYTAARFSARIEVSFVDVAAAVVWTSEKDERLMYIWNAETDRMENPLSSPPRSGGRTQSRAVVAATSIAAPIVAASKSRRVAQTAVSAVTRAPVTSGTAGRSNAKRTRGSLTLKTVPSLQPLVTQTSDLQKDFVSLSRSNEALEQQLIATRRSLRNMESLVETSSARISSLEKELQESRRAADLDRASAIFASQMQSDVLSEKASQLLQKNAALEARLGTMSSTCIQSLFVAEENARLRVMNSYAAQARTLEWLARRAFGMPAARLPSLITELPSA